MSDFDQEADGAWLTAEEAKRLDEETGKLNRALLDDEDARLYAEHPPENDVVQNIRIARVVANPYYCEDCAHFHADKITCDAYPDGIPARILNGEFGHIIAFEGDHGVRWRPEA